MMRVRLLAVLLIMILALVGSAHVLDDGGSLIPVQSLAAIMGLIALFDILSGLTLLIVRALRHNPAS